MKGKVVIKENEIRIAATWSQLKVLRPYFIKIKEKPQIALSPNKSSQFAVEYFCMVEGNLYQLRLIELILQFSNLIIHLIPAR